MPKIRKDGTNVVLEFSSEEYSEEGKDLQIGKYTFTEEERTITYDIKFEKHHTYDIWDKIISLVKNNGIPNNATWELRASWAELVPKKEESPEEQLSKILEELKTNRRFKLSTEAEAALWKGICCRLLNKDPKHTYPQEVLELAELDITLDDIKLDNRRHKIAKAMSDFKALARQLLRILAHTYSDQPFEGEDIYQLVVGESPLTEKLESQESFQDLIAALTYTVDPAFINLISINALLHRISKLHTPSSALGTSLSLVQNSKFGKHGGPVWQVCKVGADTQVDTQEQVTTIYAKSSYVADADQLLEHLLDAFGYDSQITLDTLEKLITPDEQRTVPDLVLHAILQALIVDAPLTRVSVKAVLDLLVYPAFKHSTKHIYLQEAADGVWFLAEAAEDVFDKDANILYGNALADEEEETPAKEPAINISKTDSDNPYLMGALKFLKQLHSIVNDTPFYAVKLHRMLDNPEHAELRDAFLQISGKSATDTISLQSVVWELKQLHESCEHRERSGRLGVNGWYLKKATVGDTAPISWMVTQDWIIPEKETPQAETVFAESHTVVPTKDQLAVNLAEILYNMFGKQKITTAKLNQLLRAEDNVELRRRFYAFVEQDIDTHLSLQKIGLALVQWYKYYTSNKQVFGGYILTRHHHANGRPRNSYKIGYNTTPAAITEKAQNELSAARLILNFLHARYGNTSFTTWDILHGLKNQEGYWYTGAYTDVLDAFVSLLKDGSTYDNLTPGRIGNIIRRKIFMESTTGTIKLSKFGRGKWKVVNA